MAVTDCTRTCRECGSTFVRTAKGQPTKYCSIECRDNHETIYRQEYGRRKDPRCHTCGVPVGLKRLKCSSCRAAKLKANKAAWRKTSVAGRKMRRAQWSKAGAIRRMRVASGTAVQFDPMDVFERDGWRCYICRQPTPKELRGTYGPSAPELDHVVPLAKGGAHSLANVACACRRCNSLKGAGVSAAA